MSGDARRFFDAIAGRYEREYGLPSDESRTRMRRVTRELPPPPARVLDLGVGTGRELTTLLDAGYAPTGVDFAPAMLERCARRTRPVPLVEADLWGPLPFETGAFDAAIALHGTLAHPPDDGAMARLARELARVVRAGGAFLAEVPSPSWLERAAADPRVTRTGPATAIFEDPATGARIETRLLSEAEWMAALGPAWMARTEPIGDAEWLVAAVRAG
ncbi:MAG: class I SAM-dependent methyltransferase [Polyangiaceae bacterium]|jgi:SAM-dependent methyltransferase